MAVVGHNLLVNGSSGTASSYATQRTAPEPNRLLLLAVENRKATAADIPTVTGLGLTWVQLQTSLYEVGATQRRLTVFRALGAAVAGVVTIDFAGVSQTGCLWSLVECAYVDTTGTNGSGAVVQSVVAAGTGLTGLATLAAFGNVNNATVGFFGHSTQESVTPGAGFGEVNELAFNGMVLEAEFRDTNDTTVDATWATSSTWAAIGIEVKAGTAPVIPTALPAVLGNSSGASIFVSTSGNDTTGTGLIGAPYQSITKALTVAAGNSIIEVRYDAGAAHTPTGVAGTAAGERFSCTFAGTSKADPITIRTYPPDRATGRALVQGEFYIGGSSVQMVGNVKLDGLEITKRTAMDNASSAAGDYGIRGEYARNIEAVDCDIHDNNQGCTLFTGASPFMRCENPIIHHSKLHNSGSSGTHNTNGKHDHALYWGGSNVAGVYGGGAWNNLCYGFAFGFTLHAWGDGGGSEPTCKHAVFAYNTLYDTPGAAGNSVGIMGGTGALGAVANVVTSNIFKKSGTTGTAYGLEWNGTNGSGNLVKNNLVHEVRDGDWDPAGATHWTLSGNVTGQDPLMTNPAAADFTIPASSPAKNAGEAAFMPATDFAGVTRVTPDAGAFAAAVAAALPPLRALMGVGR